MKHVPWLALGGIILALQGTVRASEMDQVKAILAVIAQRHESYNPIRVKYRIQFQRTKYFFLAGKKIDPDDKRSMAAIHEAAGVSTSEYACKGNMVLQQGEGPFFSGQGKLIDPKKSSVSAYDGKLQVSTDGNRKFYSITQKKSNFSKPFAKYNGEASLVDLAMLVKYDKLPQPKSIRISRDTAPVKDAVLRLTLVFEKNDDTYDAWLGPEETGYCTQRFERRGKRGNQNNLLFHEYSDCQYILVDGVYVLKAGVNRNYFHSGKIHELAEWSRYEAESITMNPQEIPDSLFKLDVPRGSGIIDRDRHNLRIQDPDEVEKHISAAVAAVEQRDRGNWWRWLYLALGILFLAGCGFLVLKLVKGRRGKGLPASG